MRRPLVLALPLLALFALPAAANSDGMHVFRGVHAQRFERFKLFHRFQSFNGFGRFGFGRFAGGAFFSPFVSPFAGDWGDWEGAPYAAAGGPGTVIVLNLAPSAPAARPAAAVQAVEVEHGVTVIRGPGTHRH